MINYSIAMRSVNANLFEINQAKSRINAAKAAGQAPAQADLDIVKTERQNAFAVAQYAEVMTIEKFARHIASHGCVYSRADIAAILYMAVDCMREQLLEGKKIRLGDLGDFSVNLTSKGAESADKFTAQNITGVNVIWDCGSEFKNLVKDAEFNLVASRSAQAALIKAIKEGNATVDLNGTQDDDPNGGGSNTPSGGGSTPSGGNSTPSGGDSTPQTYTLNISSANTAQGTVNTSVNKAYNAGAVVNITATPKAGYAFDKWSDGNTSASRSVAMNKDLTLVAQFKAVEPATSVDGISITSIANQPNGGSTEVNVNAELVIRGTGLQKLTAANFVHSEGKVGTYEANSDGRAVLTYDNIEDNEQTVSVVVGGETLFTLNFKGNNVFEF